MTDEEAKQWYDQMPEEKRIGIIAEHYRLKQGLCANVLGVPTGANDWVERSIDAAVRLMEYRAQLRKIIREGMAALEEASFRIRMNERECTNCRGSGLVSEQSCVICNGQGERAI